MSDEKLEGIREALEQILAELRTMNAREEQRTQKASAVQDRFANL